MEVEFLFLEINLFAKKSVAAVSSGSAPSPIYKISKAKRRRLRRKTLKKAALHFSVNISFSATSSSTSIVPIVISDGVTSLSKMAASCVDAVRATTVSSTLVIASSHIDAININYSTRNSDATITVVPMVNSNSLSTSLTAMVNIVSAMAYVPVMKSLKTASDIINSGTTLSTNGEFSSSATVLTALEKMPSSDSLENSAPVSSVSLVFPSRSYDLRSRKKW